MAINYAAEGRTVLGVFLKYYNQYNQKSLTVDQLVALIYPKYPAAWFLEKLGKQFIIGLESNRTKLDVAMENLANKTRGGVPTPESFTDAFIDQNSTFSVISEALSASVDEIGQGILSFSEMSLQLVKFFGKALPFLVIGGVAYVIYKNKDLADLKRFIK